MLYTLHTSNANEFLMHFNEYQQYNYGQRKLDQAKKIIRCVGFVVHVCRMRAFLQLHCASLPFLLSATTKLQATTITKLLLHKYPNQCKKTHLPIATLTIYSSGRNSFLAGQPLKDNDISIVITATIYTLKWSLHLDIPVLFFSYWHNY